MVPLPKVLQPGDEVFYLSLLDYEGNTLTTIPLDAPLCVPDGAINIDTSINLHLTLPAHASRSEP